MVAQQCQTWFPSEPGPPTGLAPYECTQDQYTHRWLLVASNAIFFLPVVECLTQLARREHQQKVHQSNEQQQQQQSGQEAFSWLLVPEVALLWCIAVVSGLYHACDGLDDCTKVCVLPWGVLWRADFILSYTVASLPFFWTTAVKNWPWKCVGLLASLVGNTVYVLMDDARTESVEPSYVALAAGFYLLMFGARYCVDSKQLMQEIADTSRPWLLLSVLCCAAGFACQAFAHTTDDDGDHHQYWYMHSFWHIGEATFLALRMRASPIAPPQPQPYSSQATTEAEDDIAIEDRLDSAAAAAAGPFVFLADVGDATEIGLVDVDRVRYDGMGFCGRLRLVCCGKTHRGWRVGFWFLVLCMLLLSLGVGLWWTADTVGLCPSDTCVARICVDQNQEFRCLCCDGVLPYPVCRVPYMQPTQNVALILVTAAALALSTLASLACGCTHHWIKHCAATS